MSFLNCEVERTLRAQVTAIKNELRVNGDYETAQIKLDVIEQIAVNLDLDIAIPKRNKMRLLFDWAMGRV